MKLPDVGRLLAFPWLGDRLAARVLAGGLTMLPATIPHRYDFGDDRDFVGAALNTPESWDALRATNSVFGLPTSAEQWHKVAEGAELAERARTIAELAARLSALRLSSYGVGGASLERALATQAPQLELVCTEFAPQTVRRLREYFPEAEVIEHDLNREAPITADLHLFHRIDTEFTNAQWRGILTRFPVPVLFVPAGVLDWPTYANERRLATSPRATKAGWLRNPAALERLWMSTHDAEELRVGELRGYLLRPRAP